MCHSLTPFSICGKGSVKVAKNFFDAREFQCTLDIDVLFRAAVLPRSMLGAEGGVSSSRPMALVGLYSLREFRRRVFLAVLLRD
jgi:hypothetical protein